MINNSSFVSQANQFVLFTYLIILETGKKPLYLISGGEGEGGERELLNLMQKKEIRKRNPTTIN